ncbi:MAG: ISL3 family transposase [Candidatus Omnitrophica bacterium]|nr:ISL3 family transposase [Candidatus Omnitrophota bacterium]
MRRYSITRALGLPEYKVSEVRSELGGLQIRVEPYKRKPFICSGCGEVHVGKINSRKTVAADDLGLFGQRVRLIVVKRRMRCPRDGRLYVESVAWLKPRARVTDRFAEDVYRLTSITTNTEAGWYLGIDDERVYRIDLETLEELAKKKLEPTPAAENMSVDEVAWRKYYRYLTNVIDVDARRVIWNSMGRTSEVLDRYYDSIGTENCVRIKSVALDGAMTYISSTSNKARNAVIVYDKFHVVQKLNTTVDTVRKLELRKARKEDRTDLINLMGCKQRFVLLKKKENLSDGQKDHLARLCALNEPIYKAMLLKDGFLEVYTKPDESSAEECLNSWIAQAASSGIPAFAALAEKFRNKARYILNWFKNRISSAISEGINNKIKRLKRMAYGYRNARYFLLKIHQHCGLLSPRFSP